METFSVLDIHSIKISNPLIFKGFSWGNAKSSNNGQDIEYLLKIVRIQCKFNVSLTTCVTPCLGYCHLNCCCLDYCWQDDCCLDYRHLDDFIAAIFTTCCLCYCNVQDNFINGLNNLTLQKCHLPNPNQDAPCPQSLELESGRSWDVQDNCLNGMYNF